jgi:uncharacterized protein (DUF1778 family)
VNIRFDPDDEIRLASAAKDQRISVRQFIVDAVETALRPIECKRSGAARDIAELEALWRSPAESEPIAAHDEPAPEEQG